MKASTLLKTRLFDNLEWSCTDVNNKLPCGFKKHSAHFNQLINSLASSALRIITFAAVL